MNRFSLIIIRFISRTNKGS